MNNDTKLVTQVEQEALMKDETPTIPYTKETCEYAQHVVSHILLFSCSSRMHLVTRVCATSGERQGQRLLAHVKRVTLQVIKGWYPNHSCKAVRAMVASCDMCALTHISLTTQWTTLVGRMIDFVSLNHQVIAWIRYVLCDW
jgi:hypothetical protein